MALIIVNPNPVFDRTITVNELIPGAVMRTLNVELTAGGKGINVARVLRALGRAAPLIIPTGAQDRAQYESFLETEGAQAQLIDVLGPIRTSSIYLEQVSNRVTVVNDAGHPMSKADWNATHESIIAATESGDIVLVMGSFPPDLDPNSLVSLIDGIHDQDAEVLIDVNPQCLSASLSANPDVVTPNVDEAEAALQQGRADVMDSHILDHDLTRDRAEKAALKLCQRGARRAFVTAGAAGVAMASGDQIEWAASYPVEAVSAVGAGDSFVAGLAHEWSATGQGQVVDWATAMRFGVATSANSCEQVRAGGVSPVRVQEIMSSLREKSYP
ncbi:MAG: PfkB family carbohydrate kinase [Candidatus Nanopelagicales bacterium]|nr:PfkB family carbohydrate kinase [Candidatus Nanopelagicales bacterium]